MGRSAIDAHLRGDNGEVLIDDANEAVRVNVVAGGTAGTGDGTIQDGANNAIEATVLDLASANPLTVAVTDAAGDQITSFGGGVQYTEADTDASITGTALLWEDTADTLRAVSAAKPLPVDLGANNDVTVTGTVTANLAAGTNNIGDVDVLTLPATPTGDNTVGRVKITDGTDVADILDLTNSNPITAAIVDGDGTQITSFGGGTQYTEGATDATITGTAMLWEDTADTLAPVSATQPLPVNIVAGASAGVQYTEADTDASITGTALLWEDAADTLRAVSSAKPLPVDLGANNDVTVTGTVTATGPLTDTELRATPVPVSGTVTATASGDHTVVGKAADGAAVSGNPVLIAGQDGTNAQSIHTDASGDLQIDVLTIAAGDNNIGNVDLASAIPAGTNNIGDVDVLTLPAIPAGNNNIGDVDVATIAAGTNLIGRVNTEPQTGNGLSVFKSLDLDETEEAVKATAGNVYGWYMANRTSATLYVKFYDDTVANVIVGTTVPVMTLPLPGNATDAIAANALGAMGIGFATAITVAATTGFADNDTGAPAANACIVNVFYK